MDCTGEGRRTLVKKSKGCTVFKGFPTDRTPIIELSDEKPELSTEAEDYLNFINKTYEEWVRDEGTPWVYSEEENTINKWIKAYADEDPRFHWIKNRVMEYFNISTPQTFYQMVHRSNEKNLKEILKFIQRPIRKTNLNENLWFFVIKHKIILTKNIQVNWETQFSNESFTKNERSTISGDMSVLSNTKPKLGKKKKKAEKPPPILYDQHVAYIPIQYSKILSQIHLQCSRRPIGQIIKVNFLGFSRIPIAKYIPHFSNKKELEAELPKYIREMRVGRITKPDERVLIQQCLEKRPKLREFSILDNPINESERNTVINSFLKIDFRIQWLKEKLLNFFELDDPKAFYKMCSRHGGANRHKILEFINSKYDPTNVDSSYQVLFIYSSKYTRTYYKFVKFKLEKEELQKYIEPKLVLPEEQGSELEKCSTPSTSATPIPTQIEKDGKKKPKETEPKRKRRKKIKMQIIKVPYEAAIPVKFTREVTQLHIQHGLFFSMNKIWREKTRVICLLRKNNPFQYIPQFDTYEEAMAEMPKYILIQNFNMNGLINNLFNTTDFCNQFMDKQVGEPLFPSLVNKGNGATICLPGAISKKDCVPPNHLNQIQFPWKHITNGPQIYQEYLCEKRCWPVTCDISMDPKQATQKKTLTDEMHILEKAGLTVPEEIHNLSNRFVLTKWLGMLNKTQRFSHMIGKECHYHILKQQASSNLSYALALGKPGRKVTRLHVFNKVKRLIKLKDIPTNFEIIPTVEQSEELPDQSHLCEPINMIIFNTEKYKSIVRDINHQKIVKNIRQLPQELITKIALRMYNNKGNYSEESPFLMDIVKTKRLVFPVIKDNLRALKLQVRKLQKSSLYPNALCIPHWREILRNYLTEYEEVHKASEAMFTQKDLIKKEVEFRAIFFQYLRKLYWFCREKMPRTYGPFTLYQYWKLRELVTYPFIKQCYGSHTIKFMLTHYYYNDKYYYDQFEKQFPFLIKVHKRAKYYCHMLKGFLMTLKNFRNCNSVDEMSALIRDFWSYLRNYWATSHFLSYQEIFCWALSYVAKTLVGKITAIIKIEELLSTSQEEVERTLLGAIFLLKLWKDEFNKSFSLCTSDKGGYQQILVLLEDDFFQITVNAIKVCDDLLRILKRLTTFTNVFNSDLALCVTEPKMVYYWRERCIESVRSITNYDIFNLENDKKWDHLQMEWHKEFKIMEKRSMRILKGLFQKIRDPALAAKFVNALSLNTTSKKIYDFSLRILENCIDKTMNDMKERFVAYMRNGSSPYDNFVYKNGLIPTGGIMWMQRFIIIVYHQLIAICGGTKIIEAVKQDKDLAIKLQVALKEFKDFVTAIELMAYTQEFYIRDHILLRSITSASVRIQSSKPGPIENIYLENTPTPRFSIYGHGKKATLSEVISFTKTKATFMKPRMTFQCFDNKLLEALKIAYFCDINPPEVKEYFFSIENKKTLKQEAISSALNTFLEGIFKNISKINDVKERKIRLNYKVWNTFLEKGKISSTFIPVSAIRQFASPVTIFLVDADGRFVYIHSPHGIINEEQERCTSPDRDKSLGKCYRKPKYKYRKIISDNVFYPKKYFKTVITEKNVRDIPDIIYAVIKTFSYGQHEELQHVIRESSSDVIQYHMSFLLLVFLREMLSEEELNICKNNLIIKSSEGCEIDIDKPLTRDEELLLTIHLFSNLSQEQLEKLIAIGMKFEQIYSREALAVKKIDTIVETELYREDKIPLQFCDNSDSILSSTNIVAEFKDTEGTNEEFMSTINDYMSSKFEDWLNINTYHCFYSYFENIDIVPEDAFGILISLSNIIIFKEDKYFDLKSHLKIKTKTSLPMKCLDYNAICTTQNRRAIPLKETIEVEKDWDFLTDFIFETQGDILRKSLMKPHEFNLRTFGKDMYLDARDVYSLTNRKGEKSVYKYPIMLDKDVKNKVCRLSDRYYSERKKVEYILSDSESEEVKEASVSKPRRKVQLIYEPITGWSSDESVPGDYFPQRWIDMHPPEGYVAYDPMGREAAQQMMLFKKPATPSSEGDELDKRVMEQEKAISTKDTSDDKSVKASKAGKNLVMEKIFETPHNLISKKKTIFFEPVDINFLCYALNGTISEICLDGSRLTLDGGRKFDPNRIADTNKMKSRRIRNWCNSLNYYNKNKKLIPFVEKIPQWVSGRSKKKEIISQYSSIPFMNDCNISKNRDELYPEKKISSFPHPERFPEWATEWPKLGASSLYSMPALYKIARSPYLRQKFIDPEKIKNLNSFYKYHYYEAKKKRDMGGTTSYPNYLARWNTYCYFPIQKKYRKIAQNHFAKFIKCPKNSDKYVERLFSAHSMQLFKRFGKENALAPILINSLGSSFQEKKKKDKYLFGIYNVLPVDPKLEKLRYWFSTLKNEQADLFRPAVSQLEIALQNFTNFPGNIPFFIPPKFLHDHLKNLRKPLPQTELHESDTDSLESGVQTMTLKEEGMSFMIQRSNGKLSDRVNLKALESWQQQLDHLGDQLTLENIEKKMYEILKETNYHKRYRFSLKLPPNFLQPYSENRNMLHTIVNTNEDYRWRFDLEFTSLSWRNLKDTIECYNAFLDKMESENEEDLYFMRIFLKQMDLRMLAVLRSFLLYKRIPIRSKKFIEKGKSIYDNSLQQLKEVLNCIINPSWNYIKHCLWYAGMHNDETFQVYRNTIMHMREKVKLNLFYINRIFYHNFRVLHYAMHGDWAPGFVNNFRFFKYFEKYESHRVEYSIENLRQNTNHFRRLLLEDYQKNTLDDLENKHVESLEMKIPTKKKELKFTWAEACEESPGKPMLGRPVLTLIYKYGDVRFKEPVERWLFELWFNYINGYINFRRWMSGTCEPTKVINIISKNSKFSYSLFDEFMKYSEPKRYMTEGMKHIITFINSINSYRNSWKEFYNLWSAKRRYTIRYKIEYEDLSMDKINESLTYICEVIRRLFELHIVYFGFVKIDLRHFILTKVIPRCEKLKSAICHSIMKRIKKYMETFQRSSKGLITGGDDFKHFLRNLENLPKYSLLLRDFNIGVNYAQQAIEVLAYANQRFTPKFLNYLREMEATLKIAGSQVLSLKVQKFYYQAHFRRFMNKFKKKCSRFASKWWNEGPRNYSDDLQTGLDLLSWYRKGFHDLRIKQKEFSVIRNELGVYVVKHFYFEHAFNDYRMVETLYTYYTIFQEHYKCWIEIYWPKFNFLEVYNELLPLESSFLTLDVGVKKSPVGLKIYDMISKASQTLAIIRTLQDKTIKERHWVALKKHTNYEIDLNNPKLKLVDFFNWELYNYSDFIDELRVQAVSEYNILQEIKKLSFASIDLKLEVLPYYDEGTLIGYILDSNENTKRIILKCIKRFKKLAAAKYSDLCIDCINTWVEVLTFCYEVLTGWLNVQRKWAIVKPLALSGDLEDEIPDVVNIFYPLDKEYLKMTSVFNRQRGVISQSMKRGIVKKFYQFSDALDECLLLIMKYLDTTDDIIPIFETFNKDEVISILNAKNS